MNFYSPTLKVRLLGPFKIETVNGQDLTPKGAKSIGLLALLLTAPNGERSRKYLIGKLWSDRQPEQASNSLRSALVEIRRALSEFSTILQNRGTCVLVDLDPIECDLDTSTNQVSSEEFLEGTTVRDPAFIKWLHAKRTQLKNPSFPSSRPVIFIPKNKEGDAFHSNMVKSGISQGLADWCATQIVSATEELPNLAPNDEIEMSKFVLACQQTAGQNALAIHLQMTHEKSGRELWSQVEALKTDPTEALTDPTLHRLINNSVDNTLFRLSSDLASSGEAQFLERGIIGAIRLIFRSEGEDLESARQQLAWNHEQQPSGIYLAWLAYTLSFHKADQIQPVETIKDEAERLASRALELDPFNSMTLALCSYAFTYLIGKPLLGLELANRAIEINRSNPLAWSFHSAALNALNQYENAYQSALRAKKISGNGPYRYAVESFFCIAATLTNRVDEAISAGESTLLLKPDFRVSLRYLTLLYSSKKDEKQLEHTIRKIRDYEPDFSMRKLVDDANYPSEILRQAKVAKSFAS